MKKIMTVFGTRPEAVKMCPIIKEIRKHPDMISVVCVTGQQKRMLKQVLDVFNIVPDYDLNIVKNQQASLDVTTGIFEKVKEVLETEKPDVVLVHGDTKVAFATSLACSYLSIPVGHIEAGVSYTFDMESPFSEEYNKQVMDVTSKYLFVPTEYVKKELVRHGKNPDRIYVTGNTVIDAFSTTVRDDFKHFELSWAKGSRMILISSREDEDLGESTHPVFRALRRIVDEFEDVKIIFPIHLNPSVRKTAREVFSDTNRIRLIEPLNVVKSHNFMAKSYVVITDSEGVQEEAPSLGKPVLVMQNSSEKPEGIEAGTSKLIGTAEETIYKGIKKILTDKEAYQRMSVVSNPYGDGHASSRIVNILKHG